MIAFLIVITVGLIYAALMYETNLLWFVAAAALIQFFFDVIKEKKTDPAGERSKSQLAMEKFFSDLKYSPWSKFFDHPAAREQLQSLSDVRLKAVFFGIQEELKTESDALYCSNLQSLAIDIRQELAARMIEAYSHSKREKQGNYARIYANSLDFPLLSQELKDTEALENVAQYSDAELVFAILDTAKEIESTTAELTTGREEEMEAYYHNNLRKIEFLLRGELARRALEQ